MVLKIMYLCTYVLMTSGLAWPGYTSTLYAYEYGTASKFRNVGTKSSDVGTLPKKQNTVLSTRRKFEIKIINMS